jgi:hypothetical protein
VAEWFSLALYYRECQHYMCCKWCSQTLYIVFYRPSASDRESAEVAALGANHPRARVKMFLVSVMLGRYMKGPTMFTPLVEYVAWTVWL